MEGIVKTKIMPEMSQGTAPHMPSGSVHGSKAGNWQHEPRFKLEMFCFKAYAFSTTFRCFSKVANNPRINVCAWGND